MTTARERRESAIRLAAIYQEDEGTSGYLLSEEQFAAVMAAADKYRAAGQPAPTPPARGGSRPVPAQDDDGGIPGPSSATGAPRAPRVTMTVTDPGAGITRRKR